MMFVERLFERILWSSRLLLIIPVGFSLLLAIGIIGLATADAIRLLGQVVSYMAAEQNGSLIIAQAVGVLDNYLLALFMVIFALGVYELFINKIDEAEGSGFAERLLLIRSIDDLKDRLAKIVLVILTVKFFQLALALKYESPSDLLYLAAGILFVGGALYLTHQRDKSSK